MKTLILDFIGVVADINKKRMVLDLSLKEKFSALRIFASRKKFPEIKLAFDAYQKGIINTYDLEYEIEKVLPKSAYVIPIALQSLQNNIIVNKQVLTLAQSVKNKGVQLLLMSNSTPETESIMEEYHLKYLFDGMILSTEIGAIKPEPKIYNHAIQKYSIDVENSLMIDDTEKNLRGANDCGINTIKCKSSKETCQFLEDYLQFINKSYHV